MPGYSPTLRNAIMFKTLALLATLIAGFVLFYLSAVTPRAAPADSPEAAFSAARAMVDIRAIGSRPHAVGSPADAEVRDYLVARMTALGLSPQVQRATAVAARGPHISGATVDNVIGVLPGRDRSAPALALMAHHDSVPGSPGAADDTAGIASALEIVRAIKSRGVPARDVVLIMTDGEEAGSVGAHAFFDYSPMARHIGYAINMDTGGGGGRTAMVETGPNNGDDIALYRRTAATPDSNSLTVFLYKLIPADTDLTAAKQSGVPGLNYGFAGRKFDYHSPSSTPDVLDVGALQHMGAQILPTASALAFGPLPGRAPDVVYSDLFGSFVVAYPTWFGWILLVGAAGLISFGAFRLARNQDLSASGVVRGAGAGFYIVAASGALLELARRSTGVGSGWMPYRPLLARFATLEIMMLLAGLGAILAAAAFAARGRSRRLAGGLALIAGIGASLFAGLDLVGLVLAVIGLAAGLATFSQPSKLTATWTGILILALAAAVGLQVYAPTAAFIIAWPLVAAAIAFAVTCISGTGRASIVITAAIAVVVLAWLGGLFHFLLQGLDAPILLVAPIWLAALVIWPLAGSDAPTSRTPMLAVVMIAISLALATYLHFTSPWSARYPNAVEPVYVVDPSGHRAWRASLTDPDAWTRKVLTAESGALTKLPLVFEPNPVVAAPAAPVEVPAAPIVVSAGPDGRVTITVGQSPGAERMILSLWSATPIDSVTIDGQAVRYTQKGDKPAPFRLEASQWGKVMWAGGGFSMSFRTKDPTKLRVQTAEIYDRWLATSPLPPMPPADQPWDLSGSTFVLGGTVDTQPTKLTNGGEFRRRLP